MQDPRSRVYNFSPRLQEIPKVEEFAFDRVTGFIKSSSDNVDDFAICFEVLLTSFILRIYGHWLNGRTVALLAQPHH